MGLFAVLLQEPFNPISVAISRTGRKCVGVYTCRIRLRVDMGFEGKISSPSYQRSE